MHQDLYWRWVRATTLGWLLGLILVIAISLLGDVVGMSGAQFIVGVGIGAGVGYAQSRFLSAWLSSSRRWLVASTVGMGSLFVLHDIARAFGLNFFYSLPLYVFLGSLVVGLWQSTLLRSESDRANQWILASILGWGAPAACIAIGDSGKAAFVGGVLALAAIFAGGAMLGAISGRPLVRFLPRQDNP